MDGRRGKTSERAGESEEVAVVAVLATDTGQAAIKEVEIFFEEI